MRSEESLLEAVPSPLDRHLHRLLPFLAVKMLNLLLLYLKDSVMLKI